MWIPFEETVLAIVTFSIIYGSVNVPEPLHQLFKAADSQPLFPSISILVPLKSQKFELFKRIYPSPWLCFPISWVNLLKIKLNIKEPIAYSRLPRATIKPRNRQQSRNGILVKENVFIFVIWQMFDEHLLDRLITVHSVFLFIIRRRDDANKLCRFSSDRLYFQLIIAKSEPQTNSISSMFKSAAEGNEIRL